MKCGTNMLQRSRKITVTVDRRDFDEGRVLEDAYELRSARFGHMTYGRASKHFPRIP